MQGRYFDLKKELLLLQSILEKGNPDLGQTSRTKISIPERGWIQKNWPMV